MSKCSIHIKMLSTIHAINALITYLRCRFFDMPSMTWILWHAIYAMNSIIRHLYLKKGKQKINSSVYIDKTQSILVNVWSDRKTDKKINKKINKFTSTAFTMQWSPNTKCHRQKEISPNFRVLSQIRHQLLSFAFALKFFAFAAGFSVLVWFSSFCTMCVCFFYLCF